MDTNDDETRGQDDGTDATSTERGSFDRRSGLIAGGAVLAIVLVLFVGICIGKNRDGDERFGHRGDRQGMPFMGGGERGGGGPGMGGGEGMRGGPGGGGPGGMGGGRGGMDGGPGGMGGRGMGAHGGGLGVVTKASASSLTIEPLMGDQESITVKLGDDVEVKQRGEDGAGDVEDAKVSDIDAGDIVLVRPDRGDDSEDDKDDEDTDTIDAGAILIVRDGE